MHSQHQRMMGDGKRNRVPNRPELIERYGWDVKYGSHALRLAFQGREIAREGTLTLPMQADERERVLAVKRGEVPRDEVSEQIFDLENDVRGILDRNESPLPEHPDLDVVSDWSVSAQRRHWKWT
jgi:hypothetical protein